MGKHCRTDNHLEICCILIVYFDQLVQILIIDSFISANTTNTTSTPCSRLEKDLKEYNELVTVMSEFAESYVKEKITSLKSKNRRFAELRDVEDQLKSDCK